MMRAKLKVANVVKNDSFEEVNFSAVSANKYPADGSDENNTYAKWTPSADLKMVITNPALIGKFYSGQEFYVDFTPVN
ncbi:MAG: hypothetical protein WC332_00630 [Clostridia bacterium]|jgi:hypothetical protein